MRTYRTRAAVRGGVLAAWLLAAGAVSGAKPEAPAGLSDYNREAGLIMLTQVRRDLEEYHYDARYKGVNLDEACARARQQIERAGSNHEVFRALAGVTRALQDSHTRFLAPRRGFDFDYGWQAMAAGPRVLLHRVRAGSAADRAGLRRGDQLLAIDGAPVTPATLPSWDYLLRAIEPRAQLTLTVAAPGGPAREVVVATRLTERQRNLDLLRDFNLLVREEGDRERQRRSQFREYGDVLVWRYRSFASEREDVNEGLRRIRTHGSLVLDLRGNRGGSEGNLLRLCAVLLGADTPVGQRRTRKGVEPLVAELRGERPWTGRLLVLVDGRSASASELLAAVVQARGRGLLLGDRTMGAVQTSRVNVHKVGVDKAVFYAVAVAISEVELADGRKLEGVGVTPDFLLPLAPADLAAGRDPVLAMALKQFGQTLGADAAGRDFPDDPEEPDEL